MPLQAMERPERYDPEDIEVLLRERSFDELLDAERAYVLRHLSGRAEYEEMRALLRGLDHGDGRTPAIEPEESVRINVMAAFREARTPQWRIWLNAVGAALWPEDPRAVWRPALALGTVALLIVGSITAVRWFDRNPTPELAEVRRTEQPAQPPPPPAAAAEKEAASDEVAANDPLHPVRSDVAEDRVQASSGTAAPATTMATDDAAEYFAPAEKTAVGEAEKYFVEVLESAPTAAPLSGQTVTDQVVISETLSGRAVEAKELAQNQSMADVDMARGVNSRSKAKQIADREASAQGRRLADDAALMDLMAAGW